MAESKTLAPKQAWYLGVAFAFVVATFAFVILPYFDPKTPSVAGREAPEFGLELIHGGDPGDRVRLSDLRGKVVVLDFWASWCKPCRAQSEIMDRLARKFEGKDVYVLGIATSDQREEADAFVQGHQLAYPSAFDEGSAVSNAYGVSVLPTLVLVGRDGTVLDVQARMVGERELTEAVEQALDG